MRWHKGYEKYAVVKFQRMFKELANNIPLSALTEDNYEFIVESFVPVKVFFDTYQEVYKEVGFIHGKRVGKQINAQIKVIESKDFTLDSFISRFERDIISFIIDNGGVRIRSVRRHYIQFINEIIATGLNDDKTIEQITSQLQKLFKSRKWYRWQSLRIARTETTTAANFAAVTASRVSGVVMVKEWISSLDARTRRPPHSHFDHYDMNGERVALNKDFDVSGEKMSYPGDPKGSAGNVINCYLPNNFIESNIVEGQKSFYSGEAIEIITRRGERLSVTPNHGILTTNGFVRAKDVQIGDNLICNRFVKNRVLRLVNNYIKKKFFSVQNVFSSLNNLWLSKRLMVIGLDFDTDGKSMDGYIDIVYPKVFLNKGFISKIINNITNLGFMKSFLKSIKISRLSTFYFFRRRNNSTSSRFVSFLYLSFPLLFRHFRPLNTCTIGLASKINSKRFKTSSKGNSSDSDFLRELIKTDSTIISFDDVIDIRYFNFSGHVYDFTSYNGVNIVNNIYTSNCRCTVAQIPKRDKDGKLIRITN